ncbi:MKI67 FHA domain-interacting nucleolar phosphoprotein-like [Lamellibrachia satsuma]|nr:MKI67 FHA domain-interacting nucleolar phosphoprotein-like [Lamellibrachia satsuma]
MSAKKVLSKEMTLSGDGKKEFNRKLKRYKTGKPATDCGVIYVGHIPHGFYEGAMKDYFSQFGKVTRLRVSRSRRTGNAKGYGFVEFASAAVAKIVADTMNNYLMFNRLLKCQLVDPSKVHPETFRGCFRAFYAPSAHIRSIERHNKLKSPAQQKQALRRMRKRKMKSLGKLAKLGINYNLPDMIIKGKEDVTAASDTVTDKPGETTPVTKSSAAKSPATKSPATTPSPKRVRKEVKGITKVTAVTPSSTKKLKTLEKLSTPGVDSPSARTRSKRKLQSPSTTPRKAQKKINQEGIEKQKVFAVTPSPTKKLKTLEKRSTPGVDSPSSRTRSKRKLQSPSTTPRKTQKKTK